MIGYATIGTNDLERAKVFYDAVLEPLGGRRTIVGAAIGSVFLIVAGEMLRPLGELSTFVVSAIALVVILFIPGGFLGLLAGRRG